MTSTLPANSLKTAFRAGFTLIELSIVLVIIGLVVSGVLVGQDLIRAASVRSTVTQIEKFNTAANTFREKYGYLPGDIKDPDASNFGFLARGTLQGQGDGDGVLMGRNASYASGAFQTGETAMFWVDLSTARMIEGNFNAITPTTFGNPVASNFGTWYPEAKLGQGNFIYTYSYNSANYFGMAFVNSIATNNGTVYATSGITVAQAQAIDSKMDDGMAQTGNVIAFYSTYYPSTGDYFWAAGGGVEGASVGGTKPSLYATPGSSTTCYDNSSAAGGTPGVAGAAQHYSMEMSGGSNVNCALSFKFQ